MRGAQRRRGGSPLGVRGQPPEPPRQRESRVWEGFGVDLHLTPQAAVRADGAGEAAGAQALRLGL